MKKFRLSLALIVLALVLALVPAVLAQDTLGASQGDFDLWTSANANIATITSVSYDFTAKLEVAGMGDSNVSADLKGSGVIDANKDAPAFQMDVTGTLVQGKDTSDVNAGVRIVGDNIYYTSDGKTWQGSKLEDFSKQFTEGFAQGLTGSTGTSANPSDLSSLESSPDAQAAMAALSQLKPSDFLMLTRADEGGQAHFTLNIDVAKLLASPAITSLMQTATSSAGSTGSTDTSAAQMQQSMMMAQMLFSTAKINVEEYVDPSSKMVQRAVLTVALPLDSMVGPGAAINVTFDITLTKFGEPVTVEAPANATMSTSSQ